MTSLVLLEGKVLKDKFNHWKNKYLCGCGNVFVALDTNVKCGITKTCGCIRRQRLGNAARTHGMTNSKEFVTWNAMKQRCTDKNNKSYPRYGGAGITVCNEWLNSFETFYKDMGPRPLKTSIDRIDNKKGYSKDNCRWATHSEQMKNRRPRSEWKNAK